VDILASFLGGLGLFLMGMRGVGSHLQQMTGKRLRRAIARATRSAISGGITGAALGALTQSSNAVTFIATSMVQAGIISLKSALPVVAWSNLGTAVLVLAASLDLRLTALWLLGCAGCSLAFGLDYRGRWKVGLGAVFYLGLLFLGLVMLKAAAGPLRGSVVVQQAMAFAGDALLPPFLVGAVVTMIAQSSSTVTILAIALTQSGLLTGAQAGMAVCGASLGSGLSVLLLAGGLRGTARQLSVFQTLFKSAGAVLFGLLFVAWRLAAPSAELPFGELWGGITLADRLALLFLGLQIVPALGIAPLLPLIPRLLERLSPPTLEEGLSRPRFIYDQALEDPPTALDLVEREQVRLFGQLPPLLNAVREGGAGVPGPPRAVVSDGSAAVEAAVAAFLQELLARGCGRPELGRAVALDLLNTLLGSLRETVAELAAVLDVAAYREPGDPVGTLVYPLAEALHLLLTELHETILSRKGEDAEMLWHLASDRSEMMDGMRRRFSAAGGDLPQGGHELLFRATALFERAVWLIGRNALLLRPGEDGVPG
jgi:phosphate:Na+ symporter